MEQEDRRVAGAELMTLARVDPLELGTGGRQVEGDCPQLATILRRARFGKEPHEFGLELGSEIA